MDVRFVEAGNGFNWGKFAVCRFTETEWARRSALPETSGLPLIGSQGWTRDHVWVLDLATGEGATFRPGGLARADLDKHRIWVCPLFEPFLVWLYEHVGNLAETWWADLPNLVDLPGAPASMYGYRRAGA